jgi:hypothetical protein
MDQFLVGVGWVCGPWLPGNLVARIAAEDLLGNVELILDRSGYNPEGSVVS